MLSFNSSVTYGNAGSPFGSEILLNAPLGPMYLSSSSQNLLAGVLPSYCLLTFDAPAGSGDIQYTPDNGATWRSCRQGSSSLLYVDTGGTIRLFSVLANTRVFLVPIRQGKV